MLKKLFVLLLFASPLAAQEATISAPITQPSFAKYSVESFCVSQFSVTIFVVAKDSGNVDVPAGRRSFEIPDPAHPAATVAGFFTALDTVRATETGGSLRKANFRILGYLFDNSFFAPTTVVLAP